MILVNITINELKFNIYIFKSPNFFLYDIKKYNAYEVPVSNNILNALNYYKLKFNILDNKNIFILDIGGNIGWYPSLLSYYGYSILSFEASNKNSYVLMKNFCNLPKDSNVIIINKGLGKEEKKFDYFINKNNEGKGMILCDKKI